MTITNPKSVFVVHKKEIELYETMGSSIGRQLFALAILSDVEHMVKVGLEPQQIITEIEEAKELIISVMFSPSGELKCINKDKTHMTCILNKNPHFMISLECVECVKQGKQVKQS